MKVWGFFGIEVFFFPFFLFLVIKIGKMSEFPINRVLGNFKIVKGLVLHGTVVESLR